MSMSVGGFDQLFVRFQSAVAGRYSIDRELGRGGMGIVYLAREVHLDRPVAIKLLPPNRAADPVLRERFLREARLAAKLSHPNIIPIHAVDDSTEFVFYVMSFVDGETLAHRVRTRGPVPASEGVRVLREVAWALAHAHAQGLVHRDVKPDNILLESGSGRALVADFGIAAAVGDSAGTGVSGTPEFMSPEQALGQELDARSDLYSLGATAFFAFSGRLPFEGTSPTEVLAKQVTEEAPSLAGLGLAVPRKVAQLIDRCLAKEPSHRPASADALAEQFGVALEQRRELPAALRAFVKRNGRLDGGGTIASSIVIAATSVAVGHYVTTPLGFAALAFGFAGAPIGFMIDAARKLSMLGFGQQDLAPSFKAEIEQNREEHAVEYSRETSLFDRILRIGAYTSAVAFGASFVVSLSLIFRFDAVFSASMALSRQYAAFLITLPAYTSVTMAVVGGTYLTRLQTRRDVETPFWSRLWLGKLGTFAFKIARRLARNKLPGAAMTHRATELSLGMAAENLYEGLPNATRRQLGDVLPLINRLQRDAQKLRARYDDLKEALALAGDAAATGDYADLREERDAIHAKLGDAVGALETIRLNLLRLHAGSGSVENLTTHIGLAFAVSEEVERMLAARDEVERSLKFPREIATTPV
ncbi:MAG: serine/threonine-protein kinase [Gemmatimonadales bacterium]